jgi:hypothetical protein
LALIAITPNEQGFVSGVAFEKSLPVTKAKLLFAV